MTVLSRCIRRQQMLAVWSYLHSHASEALTIARASRELGMSQSTLRRVLSNESHVGFHVALEHVRVHHALLLLADEPDLKVEALALAVGWRSRANLYAAVRRVTKKPLATLRSNERHRRATLQQIAATAWYTAGLRVLELDLLKPEADRNPSATKVT